MHLQKKEFLNLFLSSASVSVVYSFGNSIVVYIISSKSSLKDFGIYTSIFSAALLVTSLGNAFLSAQIPVYFFRNSGRGISEYVLNRIKWYFFVSLAIFVLAIFLFQFVGVGLGGSAIVFFVCAWGYGFSQAVRDGVGRSLYLMRRGRLLISFAGAYFLLQVASAYIFATTITAYFFAIIFTSAIFATLLFRNLRRDSSHSNMTGSATGYQEFNAGLLWAIFGAIVTWIQGQAYAQVIAEFYGVQALGEVAFGRNFFIPMSFCASAFGQTISFWLVRSKGRTEGDVLKKLGRLCILGVIIILIYSWLIYYITYSYGMYFFDKARIAVGLRYAPIWMVSCVSSLIMTTVSTYYLSKGRFKELAVWSAVVVGALVCFWIAILAYGVVGDVLLATCVADLAFALILWKKSCPHGTSVS